MLCSVLLLLSSCFAVVYIYGLCCGLHCCRLLRLLCLHNMCALNKNIVIVVDLLRGVNVAFFVSFRNCVIGVRCFVYSVVSTCWLHLLCRHSLLLALLVGCNVCGLFFVLCVVCALWSSCCCVLCCVCVVLCVVCVLCWSAFI